MAQTGFTPISLYYTTTAAAAPTAGNLVAGELAINTNDGILYYKDSSGVVQSIASKAGNSGSFTNLAYTGTLTGGTGVVNLGSGQFYKDASGNIGIGTSSPNNLLHIRKSTAANTFMQSSNSLATSYYGVDGAGSAYCWNANAYPVLFGTNDTERMRIDSGGNLLVGTTSAISTGVISSKFNGAAVNGQAIQNTNASNAGTFIGFFNSAGGVAGFISQATATTVLYNTASDYRLKTVIAPVSDSGQRIDALQPIEYEWNTGGRTRGFLAHKFAEVYPNSVTGKKDAIDKDGNPVYQGMQASTPEVMADLIAEIQSLRKRVAQLESK